MLKQRVITSLILAPPALAAVLWLPHTWMAGIFALCIAPAAWEWARLAGISDPRARVGYAALVLAAIALLGLLATGTPAARGALVFAAVFWTLAALAVIRHQRSGRSPGGRVALHALVGGLVLCPAWLGLVTLHGLHPDRGPVLVVMLFALVWGADIAAYFCGRRYGRRKLASRVSPGKTWEGFVGALCAGFVLGLAAAPLLGLGVSQALAFLILCGLTVAYSVMGDLVESLYKRMAGLKDSGSLLPGHGGVLDRIDSLTAAAPVFALGVMVLGVAG